MNFAPMVVNLLAFKVNVMDRNATLSFGPVQEVDVFVTGKRNQGFGEENGDGVMINLPVNIVSDQDLLDTNQSKNSII